MALQYALSENWTGFAMVCLPEINLQDYYCDLCLSTFLSILSHFPPCGYKMNEALNTNTLIYQLLNSNAQLSDAQHDAFLSKDRQLYATLLRLPNLSGQTAMAIIQRLLAITKMGAMLYQKSKDYKNIASF